MNGNHSNYFLAASKIKLATYWLISKIEPNSPVVYERSCKRSMKPHLTSASFSPSEIDISAISFVLTSYLLDTKVIAQEYDNILYMDYISEYYSL
jgi:hypothetical protein